MCRVIGGSLVSIVIAAGSLVIATTAPPEALRGLPFDPRSAQSECESSPGGFYWRYADAPKTLEPSVPVCWTYVGGAGVRAPRLSVPSAVLDEALRPRVAQAPLVEVQQAQ